MVTGRSRGRTGRLEDRTHKASAFRAQLKDHQHHLGSDSALLGHHSRGKGPGVRILT